jgi:hypothetical protein
MRTSSRVYGSSDEAEKLFAPELRSIAVNQFDSQLTRASTCRKRFFHTRDHAHGPISNTRSVLSRLRSCARPTPPPPELQIFLIDFCR